MFTFTPAPLGDLANAREPVAGEEAAAGDQSPQPPGELEADGDLVVGVAAEWRRFRVAVVERLCHFNGTAYHD